MKEFFSNIFLHFLTAYLTCLTTRVSTASTRMTSLYRSMGSMYLLSVYQPENKKPTSLSRTETDNQALLTKPRRSHSRCLSNFSTGVRDEVTCDTLEQRERVELDLDMVEVEPGVGGTLSGSS